MTGTSAPAAATMPDARPRATPLAPLGNTHVALRRGWHPVARSAEVTSAPVAVRLLGEAWALVRLPSGLAAYLDRCPHRLAPLSAGRVDGGVLRCGYHGWCFDGEGSCVEIPALGDVGRRPPRADATVPHAVVDHGGLVWLAPEAPLCSLVAVPEAADPSFLVGELPVLRTRAGAGLLIDNFLDAAHFPFVHAATIGTDDAQAVGAVTVERDGLAMTSRSEQLFPNHEDPGVAAGRRPLLQHRVATYEYRAPFSVRLRLDYVEAGGTNVITFFVQPEDADHCRIFTSVLRDDLGGDRRRLAEALAFEQRIIDEDLALQAQFLERTLPLDITTEVHLKADRLTVELRRILAAFVTAA